MSVRFSFVRNMLKLKEMVLDENQIELPDRWSTPKQANVFQALT